MSEDYKQHIDKLCEQADNGNTNAAKELIDEANKWSTKNKELIKDRDNNKDK